MEIQVNLKSIGKRRQSVEPVTYEISGHPSTVRELICAVTEAGVQEYNQRMEASGILIYLTREEIDDRAQVGKISFGVNYGEKAAERKSDRLCVPFTKREINLLSGFKRRDFCRDPAYIKDFWMPLFRKLIRIPFCISLIK